MFVCVCNAITDHDIAAACAEGCATVQDIAARTGASTCCGTCAQAVDQIINRCREQAASRAPSVLALTVVRPAQTA